MPSCCISKCTNSSKKSYSMFRIPTDVQRRNKWVNNISRSDMDPSKIYFVCEAHFAPEMWERPRVDGKKKLKSCAIPTICLQGKSTSVAEIGSVSSNINVNTETANELDFSDNVLARDIEEIESTTITNADSISIVSIPISQAAISNIVDIKKVVEEADRKIQKAELEARQAKLKLQQASMIINKLNKSKAMLIKRVKRMMYEKTKLMKEMCHLKQSKNFGKILNDDQIKTLCRPSGRCDRWSNDTIRKALRLKLSCGSNGYKEILNQGIPLPSERTLRTKLEGIEFEPGVREQMFDILSERVSHLTDD